MFGRNVVLSMIALGTMAGFAGCGIGSLPPLKQQQPLPTSVIFVSAPPTTLAVNASATIYAATTFTSISSANNTLVNYSMSCGSSNACGTLSSSDELGAIVYKAPPAIPSGGSVTVTATSIADPSLSRSATITITPPNKIQVA